MHPAVSDHKNRHILEIGGFTFWEIMDMWESPPGETVQLLWKEFRTGRVSCDCWTTFAKGPPRMIENSRRGHAAFSRWKSRLPLKGNWFSVPGISKEPDELEKLEREKTAVRILFGRYPVLFREELHREISPFRWKDIFTALRLMDFSGEIISGNFKQDVPGIQFTLPEYLSRLASVIDSSEYQNSLTVLHINDPASPAGIPLKTAGQWVSSRRGDQWAVYLNGKAVLVFAPKSGRLDVQDASVLHEALEELVRTLKLVPGFGGKISVRSVNGVSVHGSAAAGELQALGFISELSSFSLYI